MTYTVGQLIKDLQNAVDREELDWESEILNGDLHPAIATFVPSWEEGELLVPGHVVVG
jgi:hypothetical protein